MNETRIKIFISYSHRNRDTCAQIAGLLEKDPRFDVWYDKGLIPGEVYRKKIVDEIKSTDYFIVLISNASVKSEWVLDEVEFAKKIHKKILPLWIEKTDMPDDLDMILQRYHSLFWYLRGSDAQFEASLLSIIDRKEEQPQVKSLVGFGNDFSEKTNLKMRELLEKEQQELYSECYAADNACLLGMAYLFGGPCVPDREKARYYFKIAEYFGNIDGAFYLLQMQIEDREMNTWDDPDPEFCAPILARMRALADAGSIPAKEYIGDLLWYGKCGCQVDIPQSTALYEYCAKAGDARAQYMMATNYYHGNGIRQDYELAKMYANLAIEQKYIKGWRRWGKFYREGLAVPLDYEKSRACYEKGARMGDYNCYNEIGDMLYYGRGFAVDYHEAFRYYLKGEQAPAYIQGYSLRQAKEALGRCYELGHGVEKDLAMAAQKYLEGYRYGSRACRDAYLRCSSILTGQDA